MVKKLPLIISLIFAILGVITLLHPGLPPTHDGEYHIIRFYEFNKALGSTWYPRWAPDLNKGFGVPLFNYVYPLPNYIAALLHNLGVSFIDAFKLNMFVATILGAIFMYLWAKDFWGEWGAAISSVLYTYAPYHFLDIFIRGSVGEVWALAFFPGFLWAVTKLIQKKSSFYLPIASLFLSLVIFSHNILAIMFVPFALSYILFLLYQEKKSKIYLIRSIFYLFILAFGLSAIFWIPAIFEKSYVRGLEVFDYTRHFVEFYQLVFPSWGSGFSADPTTEGISPQIGIANLATLFLAIIFSFLRKDKKRKGIIIFMLIWIVTAIFLTMKVAQPIWDKLLVMQYFQFPWRLLSLIILFFAFLGGSIVYTWSSKKTLIFSILIIIITFLLSINYSKPAYYHAREDEYYVTRPNFIDGTNSPANAFNTIWFREDLSKSKSIVEERGGETRINIAYFPGWQVFVSGKKVPIEPDEYGLIKIKSLPSNADVETKFTNTPIRSLSEIISISAFVIILALLTLRFNARIKNSV